jgi:hypothetical protein
MRWIGRLFREGDCVPGGLFWRGVSEGWDCIIGVRCFFHSFFLPGSGVCVSKC